MYVGGEGQEQERGSSGGSWEACAHVARAESRPAVALPPPPGKANPPARRGAPPKPPPGCWWCCGLPRSRAVSAWGCQGLLPLHDLPASRSPVPGTLGAGLSAGFARGAEGSQSLRSLFAVFPGTSGHKGYFIVTNSGIPLAMSDAAKGLLSSRQPAHRAGQARRERSGGTCATCSWRGRERGGLTQRRVSGRELALRPRIAAARWSRGAIRQLGS